MKKSLLIRWIIILVIVGGWCYSIFPVKDRDFLDEFMRLSKKSVAILEKHADKATALQQKLEALPTQSGKDYEALQADIQKIAAETGEAPSLALDSWRMLSERIEKLSNGQDLAGNPLPEGTVLSPYQIVELACRGDNEHRSIRLCNFVKVPHTTRANNKTVLRYVRNRTAGKLHLGLDLQGGTEFVISFDKAKVPDNQPAEIVRDQILEILRNRLDKSGVTEPEIKAISETDISIRMPSVDEGDKTGIRNTIKDAAKLEFYLVSE